MSFFRGRFIPVADDHVSSLNEMTMLIADAAQSLVTVFGEVSVDRHSHISHISRTKRDCDQITRDISKSLSHSFITVIDREDIHALAKGLRDLMAVMEALAKAVGIYQLQDHNSEMRLVTDLIQGMAMELTLLVPAIDHPQDIAPRILEIRRLEREGKEIYRKAVGELFRGGSDLQDIIARKGLYDDLGIALRHCHGVGTLVELITIKNA